MCLKLILMNENVFKFLKSIDFQGFYGGNVKNGKKYLFRRPTFFKNDR